MRPVSFVAYALPVLFASAGYCETYPSKPIRFIVPFAEVDAPGLVSRRPVRGQGAHAAGFQSVALTTTPSYPSKPIRFIVPFATEVAKWSKVIKDANIRVE